MKHGFNFKDITGMRFGRLVAISYYGPNKYKRSRWNVICDCGTEKIVDAASLMSGGTASCGCWERESRHFHTLKHGGHGLPEYSNWLKMRSRCLKKRDPKYPNYGGRGIKICKRWDDFGAFYEDMGPKPSALHSIERKNVDGNYEPNNCKWALNQEQSENKTSTIWIEFSDGTKMCAKRAAERFGIPYRTLWFRLKKDWPISRLFDPVRGKGYIHNLTY